MLEERVDDLSCIVTSLLWHAVWSSVTQEHEWAGTENTSWILVRRSRLQWHPCAQFFPSAEAYERPPRLQHRDECGWQRRVNLRPCLLYYHAA